MSRFASTLIAWRRRHGRKGMPWQGTRDPYRVWLSEIMLQQTQVAAVVPYYRRFLERFPTLHALAKAQLDDVLRLWSGLGYYARGRNLHAAARQIARQGAFPSTAEAIAQLPGVGRSTAAAIAAFAFGERAAILDGNVKRVLARHFAIEGWPGERGVEERLWRLAERLLPARGIGSYTQALMDLGATVCTRAAPKCDACPVRRSCAARRAGRQGSLPAPRPKKAVPLRDATWLVLRRGREVLLERRPDEGLWGGLWTFPELAGAAPLTGRTVILGHAIATARGLEGLEHGFTHFRLRIHPVECEVRRPSARPEPPGRAWIDLHEAQRAAIPVPVRRLIGRLIGELR